MAVLRSRRDITRRRRRAPSPDAARLARSFVGATVTLGAITIGSDLGGSLPIILGVGLAVTVSIHAAGLLQNLRGLFAEDELTNARRLEHVDELTGLANRSSVMSAIKNALRDSAKRDTAMGVIFLDLDRFKAVNDSMGHAVGDELLKVVAARLRSACRSSDVVGRFGGDEFVIVIHGLLDPDSIRRVADKIRDSFADPIRIDGSQLLMGVSLGVTTAKGIDGRSASEVLRDADTAMYAAKAERSGVRVFSDQDREAVVERMGVERGLLEAFDKNQFTVFYQPVISWGDAKLRSFEALVRWQHPEHGLIAPDRFLPVVEDSGLIGRLGETVLRQTLAQANEWDQAHPDMRSVSFAVNVAERQLLDQSFPEQVAAALRWAGMDPSRLTLEITEDVMIERLDDSLTVLRELADLGVSLVIDDFGTGRSSLAWVKKLDMIEAIKIDRAFTMGIPADPVDLAIIDATMLIAESLHLDVVTEGVETAEQAQALDSLGVALMQGYLFARPEPGGAIDVEALLRDPLAGAGVATSPALARAA